MIETKENNAIVVPAADTIVKSSNFTDIVNDMISDKELYYEFRSACAGYGLVTSIAVREFLIKFIIKRFGKKPLEKAANADQNKPVKEAIAESMLKTNLYLLRKLKPSLTSIMKKRDFLPKIDFSTLALGCKLGNGTQSVVFEVESFLMDATSKRSLSTCSDRSLKATHAPPRLKQGDLSTYNYEHNMNSNIEPQQHYAAKLPREDDEKYIENVKDLMRESQILSCIDHPNIIKVHGMSSRSSEMTSKQGTNKPKQQFFLILDRLSYTLEDLLQIWAEKKHNVNIFKFQTFKEESFMQRLQVLYDISSAMNHLHKNKIVHRDLKPANVGFTSQGELKLFDFGYATKLRTKDRLPDGRYKLDEGIGTCRYMAPEVARCEPYNELADVYSFGILMWETMAIEKPFKNLKSTEWLQKVIFQRERPPIEKNWTPRFQSLLRCCWSEYISERPSFDIIVDVVEEILSSHLKE